MAATGVWAFYYIQGEEGEDRSHPNAFKIPTSGGDITLADVHRHFPLKDPSAFHFRFRINTSVKTANGATSTFFWLDITSPAQKVPLVNGRVICKLLRLVRPQKVGLIFKRKPVLKWSNDAGGARPVNDPIAKPAVPAMARQSSGSAGRPAKYSDTPPSSTSLSGSRTGSSGILKERSASGTGSGASSRTGSGSAQRVEPTPPPQESFEDFLSGGQQSAPAKRADVNLMSDGEWSAAPAPAQKSSAASDFLSSMDPLAQQASQSNRAGGPQDRARTEQPKFEDDNGQTVGPVTMSEMQKFAVSADGSNVYNPKFVDKSTKSEHVRRAMEERERQVQMDVEKAREELRQREEAKLQMNAMKENASAVLGPKLKAWAEDNGRVKNIRTLLSTMHTVMWEDSKWAEVNMGKLIQPNDIKRTYRKAMIVVHPDKSSGRNAEQLLIAERVFAALNTAWDEFMKTNP
ncbi:hypothetical protein Poli38472_009439 [Pythium oligandrum]|uniref:J domain-containing protein n=1 Tax=Pythium oligandrum TaxID=41045 RepID=A0A8K1CFL4_PYTOL|nr:hypothetical protein Poli38472_009439 [Pythium oligandrum]|eukprot:TMW61946.1 hypothetical protein Poli38472_009439 [Pythium oligandrum]